MIVEVVVVVVVVVVAVEVCSSSSTPELGVVTVHPGIFTLEAQEEDPRRGKCEKEQKAKQNTQETTVKQKKGNTRGRE